MANEISLLITYEVEKGKFKGSFNKSESSFDGSGMIRKQNMHDQNYQMKRNADNLLRNG